MGIKHIRIDTKGEDAAVRMADKAPPFSDEMKRDSAIRFESRKFQKEHIHGTGGRITAGGTAVNTGKGKSKKVTAHAGRNKGKAGKKTSAAGGKKVSTTEKGKAGKATGKMPFSQAANGVKRIGSAAGGALNAFNEELRNERRDNLGLRSIDESANALIRTKKAVTSTVRAEKQTVKAVQKTGRAASRAVKKTAQTAKKAAEVTAKAIQKIITGIARLVTFLVSNPVVLVVVAVVLVIVVLIYTITAAFQSTPKNLMGEEMYTAIQTYLRQRDKDVRLEFEEYENRPEFDDIFEDDVTKVVEVYPATSMKLMSSYLVAKLGNALTLERAQQEIDVIHSQLYRIEQEIFPEEYEGVEPVLDEYGRQVMNADGTPRLQTVTKIKRLLTVTLAGQTLKQFFDANLVSMLTSSQKSNYDWLVFISSLSGDVAPPFEDENYMARVTQEFGQPGALDRLPHRGMDFAYPSGTPILNVIGGTVVEASNHYSWGLTVVVESEDGTYRVRYAHMSAVNVGVGEPVAVGETVGLVGNTGASTGPHLHLEVEENGQLIDPREVLPVD